MDIHFPLFDVLVRSHAIVNSEFFRDLRNLCCDILLMTDLSCLHTFKNNKQEIRIIVLSAMPLHLFLRVYVNRINNNILNEYH